jgi:hypothetical protein
LLRRKTSIALIEATTAWRRAQEYTDDGCYNCAAKALCTARAVSDVGGMIEQRRGVRG